MLPEITRHMKSLIADWLALAMTVASITAWGSLLVLLGS